MNKVKKPKMGEYVLVSKYNDKDPMDPWAVGCICCVDILEQGIFYKVDFCERSFKHCWRITKEEGKSIIDKYSNAVYPYTDYSIKP